MNGASNIEISKSSLLSLKAEVLRKQQEVNLAKQQAQFAKQPTLLKSKSDKSESNNEPSNKGVKERQEKDEYEDEDLLAKSKRMLECKAILYNKLSKRSANLTEEELELNRRQLVQFDRKPRDEGSDSDNDHDSDEYDPAENSDDEWVDYVDCLGRTRRCLRKDLSYLKEKDEDLRKTVDKKHSGISTNGKTDKNTNGEFDKPGETKPEENYTENNELLSNDMRKELLRQEWEKQEQELMNKKDIHYQDVLFNEARSHGVGYYAFSKDEEERAKQQEELKKLRQETKKRQDSNLKLKELREKQLSDRLKAARNRKRARMGLAPEEDEPEVSLEKKEEENEEKRNKVEKETEEKLKDEARKKIIRPWDIGKVGLKKHYEYSQEEWVDKKRSERPVDFAPPTSYRSEFNAKIVEKEIVVTDKSLFFTTKQKKRSNFPEKSQDVFERTNIPPPNFGVKVNSLNPYKTSSDEDDDSPIEPFPPTPIVDECIDPTYKAQEETRERQGVEVPPPPTFEYYGANQKKWNTLNFSSKESLEESIAAGLRYLREQAEKKNRNNDVFNN